MQSPINRDFPLENSAVPVSELVRRARSALESRFPLQWICGEVTNLSRAASGHLYFALRDEEAQVRCVMYRSRAQLLPFRLDEGQSIEVRARVTLYEARGEFQLQVEAIREAGRGRLFEAFLRLKEKLAGEGLFDAERKKTLPVLPRGIGIITSRQAAALHDILIAFARRAPHLPLVLYPCPVQGAEAGAQLAAQVRTAGRRAASDGVDVLLLCRGGGSIEDLWAFNDEALVRAIAACPIPVVSGVGHETDFTLSDFAADLRAATPTAAAEIVSTGHVDAIARLGSLARELAKAIRQRTDSAWERVDKARSRLIHPRQNLARQSEKLAALEKRLSLAVRRQQERREASLALLANRLAARRPAPARENERLKALAARLHLQGGQILTTRRERIANLASHLDHLNPQAVLDRGYSIVRRADGGLLRSARDTNQGEMLTIHPARGQIEARIERIGQEPEKQSTVEPGGHKA
ncbi:exodeoxyribonuclease VII large subunit [Niveibacterium terrae]|uniref:exodeoxyribonuclease VII large subunit n=1 Tax=Niveibacterium terrae TaxID=3373598 RepID=UPI003A9176BC